MPSRSLVLIHLGIEGNLKCSDVRHFGHSRSDFFDACGPAHETGVALNICFVQLVGRQCLAHAVRYIEVLLVFEVSRTLPGMKLTGHEGSNSHSFLRKIANDEFRRKSELAGSYREAVLEPDRNRGARSAEPHDGLRLRSSRPPRHFSDKG